ncbi:hypothetical protein D7Z54_30790 [Salibacterium salarium]|uniref:Sporulation initiation phosphotransferase B C-terminal domain-containing protein n=1 Tax=Salibacterium salarium TaxID=284579 RepID=A0A3R9QN19_9BACI|nr:Spo0B C-terminal domain-containing protein [Salibacterium salarium]RSL29505.1 hypothetical protein D7Z54_30790 [Salibacterium salarium]
MDEKKQLDVLRHSRHDWMNIIQIIKGNIALGHFDRVDEVLDETIRKAEHDSRLSRLKIPSTAMFLLTFNWYSHWFHLDIEVAAENADCAAYEECWYEIISSFTEVLDEAVKPGAENHLLITVHALDYPYLEFDFQGELNQEENVENWLALFSHTGTCCLKNIVWNENELLFVALNTK